MIDISMQKGSIKTNLPIKVIGEMGRNKSRGNNQGELNLITYNDSVEIRQMSSWKMRFRKGQSTFNFIRSVQNKKDIYLKHLFYH